MEKFWMLSPEKASLYRELLDRTQTWTAMPQQHPETLRQDLEAFCQSRPSLVLEDGLLLSEVEAFYEVRTLREGWYPARGLSVRNLSVIPPDQLPNLERSFWKLRNPRKWEALYRLCEQAAAENAILIHKK